MSMYDVLPHGAQLKLWGCDMVVKKVGDVVPDFGQPEYIVLLREGGYVRVKNGVIIEIKEDRNLSLYPEDFNVPCYDKWGGLVVTRDKLCGLFSSIDDPYYYKGQ